MTTQRLEPLLIHVQGELDQDIDLESLARRFGTSPFHFHRTFAATLGETPRQYVERLRLEKAALLLAITEEPVLAISLAVGFKNAETFARNFRKALGYSPSGYRRMAKAAQAERLTQVDFFADDRYALSRAKFERLPSIPLLAIRHTGPYGALNESYGLACNPWNSLMDAARAADLPFEPQPIGIFYDDPTMTPAAQQRADVCVPLRSSVVVEPPMRCIALDGGWYGIAEYVGRIDTILNGIRGLADEVRRSGAFAFREGSLTTLMRAANVNGEQGVHRIELAFPVRRTGGRAD